MTTWNPSYAITEPDLSVAARTEAVRQFHITQGPDGFYVTVKVKGCDEIMHLATRRERASPKLFKDLDRLISHIRDTFPNVTQIRLHLVEPVSNTDN
jgi:hypothetical protein